MNKTTQDVLSSYQSHFDTQLSLELSRHLESIDNQPNNSLPVAPALLSFTLLETVYQHQGGTALAKAALCLPYALADKPNRFQHLLEPEDYALLKQCLLIQSLEKLLHSKTTLSEKQSDHLRKMLLAMAGDTRVILLVLLYQLTLLKQLKDSPEALQQTLAKTVQSIYAPLANRLGMGQIKWQLEDWAFRYTNPDIYQKIKAALNMRRKDREYYVSHMQTIIQKIVKQCKIKNYECDGRAKHIYSIYKKCARKKVAYDDLYDTIALRILTHSTEECYQLLSELHNQFTPISKEFDDYIANPKPNGYQSIHTVILGPNGQRVEIQMRTFDMHQRAEHGACAHWIYKEGQQTEAQQYEEKIASLRQLLDWQKTLNQEDQNNQTVITNLFADRIYVFSPQGRILDLPQGATALDFAYTIHTDIGHKTKGAQVNGKLQPLNQPLTNGDEVFIQTKQDIAPSRDWLNPTLHYLKSKHAKQKVAHWFKVQNQKEHLLKGQQLWEKTWRSKKLPKNALQDIYQQLNFKDTTGLLIALGTDDISAASLCQHIRNTLKEETIQTEPTDEQSFIIPKIKQHLKTNQRAPVTIDGKAGLLSQIAKCCRPIPGDAIVAYTTSARGVIIHQTNCPNLTKTSKHHPDKILKANWIENNNQAFEATLRIAFQDRDHFLHDITSFCAKQKLPIKHLATTTKKKGHGPFELQLSVLIQNPSELEKLISGLNNIENVLMVSRIGNRLT